MDCTTLGKTPVPNSDSPTGIDIRADDSFISLQSELQKMSNPSAPSGPDIQKILDISSTILSERSKDLTVMCYFIFAKMKKEGLSGVVEGLTCLQDMISNYWNNLYPELKRIRGRRNSLSWLNDQLLDFLKGDDDKGFPAQAPAVLKQLTDQISNLDSALANLDDESPSFKVLLPYISAIPVINNVSAENSSDTSQPDSVVQGITVPVITGSPIPGITQSEPLKIVDMDGVNSTLSEATKRLTDVVSYLTESQPDTPLLYRLTRFIAWGNLNELPPVTNGKSLLPAPQDRVRSILETLEKNSSWKDMVTFTEGQLSIDAFWLDLNRISYQALDKLGESYEAAKLEVRIQTRMFLERLPHIVDYQFNDGSPFADNLTKQWLKTLVSSTDGDSLSSASQKPVSKNLESLFEKANKLANQGKVLDAISVIQSQIRSFQSAQDQLVARINICKIALNANRDASTIADVILDTIKDHDLVSWDPEIAADALKTVYQAYITNPACLDKASRTLTLLVKVDAACAFSMTER